MCISAYCIRTDPLVGIIRCQLFDGLVEEAEQQLDFLMEIQSSIGSKSELLYLSALLAQKKLAPVDSVLSKLDQAVDLYVS